MHFMFMDQTHKHYIDFEEVIEGGRAVIYKRADHKRPRYTARIQLQNITAIVRSTRTFDVSDARSFAKDLYYELESKRRNGEQLRVPLFEKVFHAWAAQRRIKYAGKAYTKDDIRAAELQFIPFFTGTLISKIDVVMVDAFLAQRRVRDNLQPSFATLKQDVRRLKSVLVYAKKMGHIKDVPEIELPQGVINARPDLDGRDYKALHTTLRRDIRAVETHPSHHRDRQYLYYYILILANSGIRTGEAQTLTWASIFDTVTIDGDKRKVLSVVGKTGAREVVCNESVNDHIIRLKDLRIDELKSEPPLSEPIFCHFDGSPIKSFKKSFSAALKRAGVLYDRKGNKRVPYSLRHTYATMRLQQGVSVYTLAMNMGTSVAMIEKYYGKVRMTAPAMATEATKMGSWAKK
ncbi:MAG: tyrosine-type recombinase/integrase [Kordiimonadaceae bacterium]|nr:tyrosine-type recombinase/integrase [Kordiimonadaceae bacterium]